MAMLYNADYFPSGPPGSRTLAELRRRLGNPRPSATSSPLPTQRDGPTMSHRMTFTATTPSIYHPISRIAVCIVPLI